MKTKALLLIPCLMLLAGCDTFESFLNDLKSENTSISNENQEPALNSVLFKEDEWKPIHELGFKPTSFASLKSYSGGNLQIQLNYYQLKNISVSVRVMKIRASKETSVSVVFPCDEEGYPTTRSYTYYVESMSSAVTPTITSVSGYVKPSFYYQVNEKDGAVYEDGRYCTAGTDDKYSYCGQNTTVANKFYKIPTKVGKYNINSFGRGAFDIFGFENVEGIIIPESYRSVRFNKNWKSVSKVNNIFLEKSDSSQCFVESNLNPKYYSENEPTSNKDQYWHYINNEPVIWQ